MVERFLVLSFFIAAAVLVSVTFLCGIFGGDTPFFNLVSSILLTFAFNPADLKKNGLKVWGAFGLITGVLAFYIPAKASGAWLYALFILAGILIDFRADKEKIGRLIIVAAFYFNLSFITNTAYSDVQYDFASCYNYIEYIMENNFMFWRENPLLSRPSYSSYHPILHFFITSLAIKGALAFDPPKGIALETAQVFISFFMLWYYITAAKILRLLEVKKRAYLISLSFISFFPAYNAMAGFFNNDCLLLPLQAGTVYYSLLYFKHGGRKNLAFILLFATLGGLTKLSETIVLPAVAAALALRLWQKRDKETFMELFIFGVLLIAGLLIWPLYQHIRLGVGADFVPPQPHLGLSAYSYAERLSLLGGFIYKDMFYHDFGVNLWETMTKTALFLQWDFSWRAKNSMVLLEVLVFCYKAILLLIAGGAFSLLLWAKKEKAMLVLTAVLWAGIMAGMVLFSLKHPFMCNQDFRYAAILTLPLGMMAARIIDAVPLRLSLGFSFIFGLFSFLSAYVWWIVSW